MSDKPDLNLAIIQTQLHWQDPHANREHFAALLGEAEGADLVVLPETFTTGFSMQSSELAEPHDGPTSTWLLEQAARINAVICGSVMLVDANGQYRNRLLWARPDGSLAYYDKRHLFRMAGEHEHFSAGNERVVLEVKGWQVRPLICYDLRFPVWARTLGDTDLLIYTANWPAARRQHWNRLLPARAIENLCYAAGINRIGQDGNGHAYSGDSQVLDFQGEALLAPGDGDGVFKVSLSAEALRAYRERFPVHQDADRFSIVP